MITVNARIKIEHLNVWKYRPQKTNSLEMYNTTVNFFDDLQNFDIADDTALFEANEKEMEELYSKLEMQSKRLIEN